MRRSSLSGLACAAAVAFFLSQPLFAIADDLSFFPSIVSTEGEAGIDASSQSSEYSQNGKRNESTATFLSERMSVGANGFIYHPRFEVFLARLSGALNQWDIHEGGQTGPSNSSATTLNYEFRTTFLPEHPYNLELFALHQESAAPQNFWSGQRGDVDTRGAIFTYKEYPFFVHMSYNDSIVDSAQNRTDTIVYRVNATLRGEIMNQTASYAHIDTSSAFMVQSTQEEYAYNNSVAYSDLRLYSRLTERKTEQVALNDRELQLNSFIWSEQLHSPLPWNFDTDLSYWYMDENDLTTGDATGPAGSELFNRSTNAMFHLTHHLYRSLVTSFTANRMDISSSLGDITTTSWSLNMGYTKAIPAGRLAISGQYGKTDSEHTGTVTIINELHNVALFGSFTLNSPNVAESTIVILVKDQPTGIWMTLPQANYLVTHLGNTIQITILNVSPATLQPPGFVYEFQASYSLANQSKIDMTTTGYTIDADIIRDLLSGYFSYGRSEQEVVSGTLAGGPDVMVSEAAGLKAHKGGLSGFVEYQTVRSRLTPWEAWKSAAQYRTSVSEDVSLSAGVSANWYSYSASAGSTGYRSTSDGMDVGMDFRFPSVNLALFVSSSYYTSRSVIDTDTMSFNSYVTWQKGLLSINGGVQMNQMDTTTATGKTSLFGNYAYMNLTRKLF